MKGRVRECEEREYESVKGGGERGSVKGERSVKEREGV